MIILFNDTIKTILNYLILNKDLKNLNLNKNDSKIINKKLNFLEKIYTI